MKRSVLFFWVLLFFLTSVNEVFSIGVMYSRKLSWWSSDDDYKTMWIKSFDVNTNINEQVAETKIDQVFYNENNYQIEAVSVFPLPENAVITEFYYWYNGKRYEGTIKIREEAEEEYNDKIRRLIDPAMLREIGDNLFKLNIAPINPNSEVRFEITYVEPLLYEFGVSEYKLLLNSEDWSAKPLERVYVEINSQTGKEYTLFKSPTHQNDHSTEITKISKSKYKVVYGDENYIPNKDLVVQFEILRDEIDFNLLSYFPAENDSMGTDGFYSLWVSPPNQLNDGEVIPKDFVFVVDVSSSMLGDRLAQLKEAMNFFLTSLDTFDRFNIISFSTHVNKLFDDLVKPDSTNLKTAEDYVYSLSAQGLTNIRDALVEALGQTFKEENNHTIVFITDGLPTIGVTKNLDILEDVKEVNEDDIGVFSIGIGKEVDKNFLNMLSSQNFGYSKVIEEEDLISEEIEKMILRLSNPVMNSLAVQLGSANTDNFPSLDNLPSLFVGSQLVIVGRYQTGGSQNVSLSGLVKEQPFEESQDCFFENQGGEGHLFVTRLWAREKINDLLNLIILYGENQELIDAIVELSLRYQILTPYTAFYVDPTSVEETCQADFNKGLVLFQNYPNPFNRSTTIKFYVKVKECREAVLSIYNIMGGLVEEIRISLNKGTGFYEVQWDGEDENGCPVATGVYLYQLKYGNERVSKSMMLVK